MTKISVLFPFTFIFFNCGIQAKSLVDGKKNEREIQQDEIASQESLSENSRFPIGYGESNGYSKVGSMYDMSNYRANLAKRSLREHNPSQRQTGIIYGGGKPIGILQPYQESFKFMPIKEEHVYSLDGGRSNIDQQEPYINLMYPLARFTRSEDAIRMAELEAAKAEFLDKHYPSMLVDFKIHNKLHPSGYNAKSVPTFNLKREETNPTGNDMQKKKRESQNPSTSNQKLHKRENQHVQKRDSSINKKQPEQKQKKREDKKLQKRVEKSTVSVQNQHTGSEYSDVQENKLKMKRQSKLTDSEFENLKNSVSKRNSNNGNLQVIEEDLKGLLSDMGLIEDDLEENAEEMEESKSAVVQDEDLEDGSDTTIQKGKEETQVEQKRDTQLSTERKKRAGRNKMDVQTRIPLSETGNSDSKKRTITDSPNKRSVQESQDAGKRLIEVSFSSKEDKEALSENSRERDSCPKPAVIPNKREIINDRSSGNKRERSASVDKKAESKRSEEASVVTTETYEQYEQRVAREIKNKIQQLKEEVKRELGALEPDKEEEDDDDILGESQRKKRFIMNTLMDEETRNIDPNENLDSIELEPHIRRRRTLSTDMMSSFDSQKSPMNSYEKSKIQDVNLMNFDPMPVQNKFDFDVGGYYGSADGRGQSFTNKERKDEITEKDVQHSNARTREGNERYISDIAGTRWEDSPMYVNAAGKMYVPEYQRSPGKYVALSSRRSSRNDYNSEGGSYNDYEGDSLNPSADEEADAKMNSVVDMTRKSTERLSEGRQQFNPNAEHSPRKLQGYNQKYFYYYVGRNGNGKQDNMAPSPANGQRLNPMYNYQRLSGQYPRQLYKMSNRFDSKQYKGGNENGLANKRAFQRRFDNPFARRRKRYINFMTPPYRDEVILTNGFFRNSSVPRQSNYWINSRSGKSKVTFGRKTARGAIDDGISKDHRNTTGLAITEKGKNISRTNNDESGQNALVPWNSLMKKYEGETSETQARSTDSFKNVDGMQFRNENQYEPHYRKKRKNTWHGENFAKSLYNSDFNKNTKKQSEQTENNLGNAESAEKYDEDKKTESHNTGEKFSGRKMLSWLVHGNNSQINPEKVQITGSEMISNKDDIEANPKNDNIMNETYDYHRATDEGEYDENYYSDLIATSSTENTVQPIHTEVTSNIAKIQNTVMIPAENSNGMRISDNIVQEDLSQKNETIHSNHSYIDIIDPNSTDLGVNQYNLFVQNASLLSAEWKRRKRNIQPEYHQPVRRKRYWLWPTLSFPRNNAPEEDEEFDQNDPSMFQNRQGSKRSSGESSISPTDNLEEDVEDFANDPRVYDREKRNTESRLFYPGNKPPYFYENRGSLSSYMPIPRNRRFVKRQFREPRQQLLTEISDSELFGALPQSYAGELARFKRVKRFDRGAEKT